MMLRVLISLLLLATPALAQPIQFDSTPAAPAQADPQAGLKWLQREPVSLFDLGMMELSNAATKATEGMFDVGGAVAEYQEKKGLIVVSLYARTPYSEQNCGFVLKKLRDTMFPKRTDAMQLAGDLSSFFTSYGPQSPERPDSIGGELLMALRFAAYMPGGVCQMGLMQDEISYWKDPNAKAPAPAPKAATPSK